MVNPKRSYNVITIVIICLILVTIFSFYNITIQSISTNTSNTANEISSQNNQNNQNNNNINNNEFEIIDNKIKEPLLLTENNPNLRSTLPSSSSVSSTSTSPPISFLDTISINDFEKDTNNNNNNNNKQNEQNLHAVTYASHGGRDDRFCRAVESAIRHDIHLIILGWGVKWTGLAQKLDAAMLYASRIPKDDIIMFTDAFDVMFTNTPSHILEEYNKMNSNLIFAGECGCWPHVIMDHGKACFEGYPQAPTPYRYLNSGTWIGKAESAKEMLQAVIKEAGNDFANANDQKLVADMFIEKRFNIKLDYYANLFQSMHMTFDRPLPYCHPYEDIEVVQDGRFYNKRTKTYPSVFHFNGGGKTHHLDMESKLWYKRNSKYNTKDEKMKLAETLISAPVNDDYNRVISFRKLCPTYFQ